MPEGRVLLRVRDLDDGRPLGIQLPEQLHDLAALRRMQVAGRLVGEDELRLRDHRARDTDELLLPAGELARIEVLLRDDLEAVQRLRDDRGALGSIRDSSATPALIGALQDDDRTLRRAAVRALAQIRTDRALDALRSYTDSTDTETQRVIDNALRRRRISL